MLLQSDHGDVQVRDDQRRLLHHVHQRGQGLLRDDSGLLRLHEHHGEVGLYLLHHDEQYARLLLLNEIGNCRGMLLLARARDAQRAGVAHSVD
jgi:hypothetical protein